MITCKTDVPNAKLIIRLSMNEREHSIFDIVKTISHAQSRQNFLRMTFGFVSVSVPVLAFRRLFQFDRKTEITIC